MLDAKFHRTFGPQRSCVLSIPQPHPARMASSARLSLQPLRPCCDPKTETISAFTCASNAPVQARWANAQRAGPAPPNPPAVACNRLLGGIVGLTELDLAFTS